MKKILAVLAVASMTLMALGGTADAQLSTTGEMELNPASVDAAGEHEIEVSLSGFTGGLALFVLPCPMPEDMSSFDAGTCDTGNLTPTAMGDDGTGSVMVTYDVPAEGLVIVAGDAARTESAAAVLSVGEAAAADSGDDDGALADTGVETGALAVVAGTLIAGGALVVGAARRFN